MSDQYDVKNLYRNIFKTEVVSEPPWPRMILCAVATLIPILAGLHDGELSIAIFGALAGYLLALNDHMGTLKHRLWVTTLSAIILTAGFALGFKLQGDAPAYYIILAVTSYWIGLLGGEGAELERAVLFALIGFVTAFTTPGLTSEIIPKLIPYAALGFICLIIGGPIIFVIGRHQPVGFERIRHSLKRSLTKQYEKHVHAVCFVITVLVSVWISTRMQLEHASWVTVTVLLVLRPDRRLTVFKTLQRFVGTLVGVLLADALLVLHPSIAILIAVLAACAFIIPWAMIKSYWLTSFFVTVFVVVLLELAAHQGGIRNATLRLEATFIGCVLSLSGVALARFVDRLLSNRSNA